MYTNLNLKFLTGGEGCAAKCRWRLIFALLGCSGMAIIYGLKVNLSVAIVAMVNQVSFCSFTWHLFFVRPVLILQRVSIAAS